MIIGCRINLNNKINNYMKLILNYKVNNNKNIKESYYLILEFKILEIVEGVNQLNYRNLF